MCGGSRGGTITPPPPAIDPWSGIPRDPMGQLGGGTISGGQVEGGSHLKGLFPLRVQQGTWWTRMNQLGEGLLFMAQKYTQSGRINKFESVWGNQVWKFVGFRLHLLSENFTKPIIILGEGVFKLGSRSERLRDSWAGSSSIKYAARPKTIPKAPPVDARVVLPSASGEEQKIRGNLNEQQILTKLQRQISIEISEQVIPHLEPNPLQQSITHDTSMSYSKIVEQVLCKKYLQWNGERRCQLNTPEVKSEWNKTIEIEDRKLTTVRKWTFRTDFGRFHLVEICSESRLDIKDGRLCLFA